MTVVRAKLIGSNFFGNTKTNKNLKKKLLTYRIWDDILPDTVLPLKLRSYKPNHIKRLETLDKENAHTIIGKPIRI